MLVENKNQWCWVDNYGYVGEPQDSLQAAIDDYFKYSFDKPGEQSVNVGHPNYYIVTIDAVTAEQMLDDIVSLALNDEIEEWSDGYLEDVKKEHIDELRKELTTVFRAWEKKYGYENTGYVVLETKSYPVDNNGKLIVV